VVPAIGTGQSAADETALAWSDIGLMDPVARGSAAVVEPLTEREQEVLRYLPTHLTLRQIGMAMYLSTNTVKTHVKAIYRKIGAFSRHDAVTIARTDGLI
jgi:LuxR family maltose regulon positive regulatory protein